MGAGALMAAFKDDGSVVAWGAPECWFAWGDSSSVVGQLAGGVQGLHNTEHGFAAHKLDGSVVAWGRHQAILTAPGQLAGGVHSMLLTKLQEMLHRSLTPDLGSHNAAISATKGVPQISNRMAWGAMHSLLEWLTMPCGLRSAGRTSQNSDIKSQCRWRTPGDARGCPLCTGNMRGHAKIFDRIRFTQEKLHRSLQELPEMLRRLPMPNVVSHNLCNHQRYASRPADLRDEWRGVPQICGTPCAASPRAQGPPQPPIMPTSGGEPRAESACRHTSRTRLQVGHP